MGPTQVQHSSRAAIRTGFAVFVAVLSLIPTVLATSGLDHTVYGAQIVAVAAAVTKVFALPGVNDFIEKFLPFLAAEPQAGSDGP
ncbi:hypothetical protein [Nocardia transvalensis]|uniref:hypothetical protein n=1 Tax=Nocardia transvalensis TaxID=37333 RepID=UPI0018963DAE|nr:hypothetical protein [Nocardia transvalensis]MBF6330870.1 hypothetical protein [Nocardia transvalensis]